MRREPGTHPRRIGASALLLARCSLLIGIVLVGGASCGEAGLGEEEESGRVEGALTGTLNASRAGWGTGDVNLTAGGSVDWARWGSANVGSFDHKSGATQRISNYVQLGSTAPIWLHYVSTFSWSDGTPTASATNNLGGIYIDSPHVSGDGFRLTVPADTTTKTLKLYLGNWNVRMRVQATLSDGSASPYVDTSWDVPTATYNEQVYTVNYAAGSSGQTLTVDVTIDLNHATSGDLGEVWLQAATLATNTDTTPPSQPTNAVATAVSSSQINLGWTASTDNVGVKNYRVQRCQGAACTNFALIATVAGTSTTYSNTGLLPSTSYRYRVRAADAAGNLSTFSNIASATTSASTGSDTTAPTVPAGLSGSASSSSQINLSWTAATDPDNTSAQLSYKVFRNGANVGTTSAGVTSYLDTGLSASTTYNYTVAAQDPAGNTSAQSTSAAITTLSGGGCGTCASPLGCGNYNGLTNVCGVAANFTTAENPISQGGNWTNGHYAGTGGSCGSGNYCWGNVKTSGGYALGADQPTSYGDPTAIYGGTWHANQTAQVTVHPVGPYYGEVEVRLRTTITPGTPGTITGYEVYCNTDPGNPYCHIASWGGPNGSWINLDGCKGLWYGYSLVNNDVLKGTVTGTSPVTITLYINGQQHLQVVDDGSCVFNGDNVKHGPWTSGRPGIGFYGGLGSGVSHFEASNN